MLTLKTQKSQLFYQKSELIREHRRITIPEERATENHIGELGEERRTCFFYTGRKEAGGAVAAPYWQGVTVSHWLGSWGASSFFFLRMRCVLLPVGEFEIRFLGVGGSA